MGQSNWSRRATAFGDLGSLRHTPQRSAYVSRYAAWMTCRRIRRPYGPEANWKFALHRAPYGDGQTQSYGLVERYRI